MFENFKNVSRRYAVAEKPPELPEPSLNLTDNLIALRKAFDSSGDLTIREMRVGDIRLAVVSMDGLSDKQTLGRNVLTPVTECAKTPEKYKSAVPLFAYLRDSAFATSDQLEISSLNDMVKMISSGFAVIMMDDIREFIAIGVQLPPVRSIGEPATEQVQRGSREGLTESSRVNMAMIRRRIKSGDLKFEVTDIGTISKTEVILCYLQSKAEPMLLRELRKRLATINLEIVLETAYLQAFLDDNKYSLFTSVGVTERPDTVCGKIGEGRIGILVDGTPHCLILPYLFTENFQSADDYYIKPFFASFTRVLKYIAFIIAVALPGFFVAMATFHPEMFQIQMLSTLASAGSSTNVPLMVEVFFGQFIYEVIREAGLRLPRPVGQVVGIVGGLVIGDAAVSAGLIGAPTVIVIALTAICSYLIPSLYDSIVVLRIGIVLISGLLGLYGIALFLSFVLIMVCSMNSCGIPFTTMISPFCVLNFRDGIIRAGWRRLAGQSINVRKLPGARLEHGK